MNTDKTTQRYRLLFYLAIVGTALLLAPLVLLQLATFSIPLSGHGTQQYHFWVSIALLLVWHRVRTQVGSNSAGR